MRFIIFITAAVVFVACKTTKKEATTETAQWSGQMQSMAENLKKLVPYLYDRKAFTDPKNRDEIKMTLKNFAQAAHKIEPSSGKNFIGDQLLLEYSISGLQSDLNRSLQSFELGQFEYSRSVAKTSLSSCFRCHSVKSEGATAAWKLDDIPRLTLAPLEKADLLVAARKYEEALVFMESQLNSPEFLASYGVDFEGLLRRYMALLIRVEKDPQRALNSLNKILDRGDTPNYVLEQAEGWKKSLEAWRREKSSKIKNPNDLFAQVDQRFKRAVQLQTYEKDHAGDVEYLRATTVLHEGLPLTKTPQDQARALFLLGRAYEVLDDLGEWNLHENYYEACVLRDPKSPIAKNCLNRLEASLYLGYSGSAGVNLPADERARLKKLREQVKAN